MSAESKDFIPDVTNSPKTEPIRANTTTEVTLQLNQEENMENDGKIDQKQEKEESRANEKRKKEVMLVLLKDITLHVEVARGSNGVVFEAHSTSHGIVSAKSLHVLENPTFYRLKPHGEVYEKHEKGFLEEIKKTMQFSHRNIMKCHGVWFSEEGIPYMICELGICSFEEYLLAKKKLSLSEAIKFGIQIAEGINYLHEQNAMHRDIKPKNMVLFGNEKDLVVKLIDFGDACNRQTADSKVGTAWYRDPKVENAGGYDKSVDIYSFGCVFVDLLCGCDSLVSWKSSEEANNNKLSVELEHELSKLGPAYLDLVNRCICEENRITSDVLLARLNDLAQLTAENEDSEKIYTAVIEPGTDYLEAYSQEGDFYAQNNLGYCYEHGQGVEKDLKKAVEFYTLAANHGYPPAQHNLGCCYEYGRGVEKDLKKAIKWYTLAANQGDANAQNNLESLEKQEPESLEITEFSLPFAYFSFFWSDCQFAELQNRLEKNNLLVQQNGSFRIILVTSSWVRRGHILATSDTIEDIKEKARNVLEVFEMLRQEKVPKKIGPNLPSIDEFCKLYHEHLNLVTPIGQYQTWDGKKEIKPGDHIAMLIHDTYFHHAIYIGEHNNQKKVVEVNSKSGRIERNTVESFFGDSKVLCVVIWNWYFKAEDVIARAEKIVGSTWKHKIAHNSEHFASWCKMGQCISRQIDQFSLLKNAGSVIRVKMGAKFEEMGKQWGNQTTEFSLDEVLDYFKTNQPPVPKL